MTGPVAAGSSVVRDPLVRGVRALDLPRGRAVAALALGVGALSCAVGLMAVSAWLIARAAQQPPILTLSVAVVTTRALGLGRGVLRYAERLAGHDVALRGAVRMRDRVYARLAAADPAVVATLHRGDVLARVGSDVDALSEVVVRGILPFGVVWGTCLVTAAGLALVLPVAALAVLGGMLVAAVAAPWLVARAALAVERDGARLRGELAAETLTLLDHADELAVAGVADHGLARIRDLHRRWAERVDAATRPAGAAAFAGALASGTAGVIALVASVAAVRAGSLSPVMAAVVVLTALAVTEGASGLPAAAVAVVGGRAAAERLLPLLDLPARPRPTTAPTLDEDGPALLVAERLTTGWPGATPVGRGITLVARPGDLVTVQGSSGSGKTTLLLTLAGLLPPRSGAVRAAGPVLFTGEDAHVFATTVRENLRLADPTADDDALRQVLGLAGAGGWLDGLPEGLDTPLGSGGRDVSGGERRRLLIARALLSPARILLVDEPAEHLDPRTADTLLTDLAHLARTSGRAVVVATHRPVRSDLATRVQLLRGLPAAEDGAS